MFDEHIRREMNIFVKIMTSILRRKYPVAFATLCYNLIQIYSRRICSWQTYVIAWFWLRKQMRIFKIKIHQSIR